MIKAIFFDVDGTLVSFQTHTISPATLDALHALRQRGVKLFLSTGRHQVMLGQVRDLFSFDGYVTLSGQYCYAGDQVIHRNPMTPQAVEELVSAAGMRPSPASSWAGRRSTSTASTTLPAGSSPI